MKFFTPELFLRCNSSDEATAFVALEEWEAAIIRYREYLDSLSRLEIDPLTRLHFHDGEILNGTDHSVKNGAVLGWPSPIIELNAMIAIRLKDEIVTLTYILAGQMTN